MADNSGTAEHSDNIHQLFDLRTWQTEAGEATRAAHWTGVSAHHNKADIFVESKRQLA